MSQYITVNEYAALHHKQPVSVRKLAQRGSLKSAKKIGGVWLIDKEEQYPDHRRSGSVKSFEMVRGMYLVDEIAYVEGLPSTYVRIGDQWCKKDVFRRQLDKTNPEPTPVPYDPFAGEDSERKMNAGWFEAAQNFGCLPRDTDFVRKELKRAATLDELAAVAAKFDAVKKSERTNVLGRFYGPEYEYTVREAVLELPDGVNAMSVEHEFRRMGIEADNYAPGVVAVRIG